MPITPLHLGILAPINHFFPKKVSNLSFILVNLWLDASAIAYYAFGLEMGEFHGPYTHSFLAAMVLASIVAVFGFLSWKWVLGAYLGGFSHILLDAMVHSEMLPFYPEPGNPFYWGGMDAISLVLVIPFIWLTTQYVSLAVARTRAVLVKRRKKKLESIV